MVGYDKDNRDRLEPRTDIPKRNYDLVESVEQQAHRIVTIETRATNQNLAKCDTQSQSPLFRLPAELRSSIFEYACLPYDDDECRYHEDFPCGVYRPEHQARHITSASILLTCRRAWLETNHLPLQLGDHSFWFRKREYAQKRPYYLRGINADEENRLERFLHGLTVNNRENLKNVHLYAETRWLEEYSGSKCVQTLNIAGVCPEILTVTISAGDWPGWEHASAQLRLDDSWLVKLLEWPALPRLREIRLELEAGERKGKGFSERKVSELERIKEHLRDKFAVVNRMDHFGSPTSLILNDALPPRTWKGIARERGYNGMTGCTMSADFTIETLVWRVILDPDASSNYSKTLQLPVLQVDQACEANKSPGFDTPDQGVIRRFEQEWQEKGSLLKFAPTANATA